MEKSTAQRCADLKSSLVGKIALEVIQKAGGPQAVQARLKDPAGMKGLFLEVMGVVRGLAGSTDIDELLADAGRQSKDLTEQLSDGEMAQVGSFLSVSPGVQGLFTLFTGKEVQR